MFGMPTDGPADLLLFADSMASCQETLNIYKHTLIDTWYMRHLPSHISILGITLCRISEVSQSVRLRSKHATVPPLLMCHELRIHWKIKHVEMCWEDMLQARQSWLGWLGNYLSLASPPHTLLTRMHMCTWAQDRPWWSIAVVIFQPKLKRDPIPSWSAILNGVRALIDERRDPWSPSGWTEESLGGWWWGWWYPTGSNLLVWAPPRKSQWEVPAP